MPNPTANKPATCELNSGHEMAATLRSFVGFHEGSGAPLCLSTLSSRGQVPPLLCDGYGGLLTGGKPTWVSNGSSTGSGYAARWIHSTQQLKYRDCGWVTSTTPTTRTLACVFRPRFAPSYGAQKIAQIMGNGGGQFAHGPGIQITTAGVLTFGFVRSGAMVFPTSGITLTAGRWYALAVQITSTARTYYCYDYTAQTLVSGASGNAGSADSALTLSTSDGDLILSAAAVNTSGYEGAVGDFDCALLDDRAWDSTIFAAFYGDPWGVARGSYAPTSSTLVTGQAANFGSDQDNIYAACSRPTGGASSGIYSRQWQLAFASDFSDAANISGATAANLTLPKSSVGERVAYLRCVQSDGSASVTSTGPKITGTASVNPTGQIGRGTQKILWIGDSISTGVVYGGFGRTMVALGHRVHIAQRGVGSTAYYHSTAPLSWQPNTTQDPTNGQASTTLLADALTVASQDGVTDALVYLGHNDAALIGTTAANLAIYASRMFAVLLAGGIQRIGVCLPNMRTSSESANALQTSYRPVLRDLCDERSIFLLDVRNYEYGAQNPGYSADGTHPDAGGPQYWSLGINIALAWLDKFDPTLFRRGRVRRTRYARMRFPAV